MKTSIRNTLAVSAAVAMTAVGLAAAAQELAKSNNPTAAVPPVPVEDAYYGYTWKRLDANGDGRVSRAEYLAYHDARWSAYDSRKLGYMDRSEARRLILEREMSKTDGTPMGDPQNPMTKK